MTSTSRKLRRLRNNAEQDDANQGKFGQEFDGSNDPDQVQPLTTSEVKILLERQMQSLKDSGLEHTINNNPVLTKTQDYVEMFSRYKTQESVREARNILSQQSMREWQIRNFDEDGNLIEEENENGEGEGLEKEKDKEENLKLSDFEVAQLANLGMEDVEEAKTLIPTLAQKDDYLLRNLLQELSSLRKFQT